jgi:hypothetical protein
MLNDHDRETLDEIQHRLTAEDPEFTSAFDRKARRLGASVPGRHQKLVTVLIVVTLLLTAFMIMVQAAGPAFFFTAVSCGLIWRWRARRPQDGHQRR